MKNKKSRFTGIALIVVALLLVAGQRLGLFPTGETAAPDTVSAVFSEAEELLLGESESTAAPRAAAKATATKKAKATATPKATKKAKATATPEADEAITSPQAIADYLFAHGELPDNFITKQEAQALGWDSSRSYVGDVAPGKSIGGDRFGNYDGVLPKTKGVTYRECDCNYTGGRRGADRVVYSSDGHVYVTYDHYESFTELFPSGE